MSFYTTNRPGVFPGVIPNCNANGVCERVCIEVTKVFDACLSNTTFEDLIIVVTDPIPPAPALPLTYISALSNAQPATITNINVIRFEDQPNFARVSCTITIPLTVTYRDANGVVGTGISSIVIDEDVVLYVPQPSIIPFEITCFASAISSIGTYIDDLTFQIDICVAIILKVVAKVDLLVPSYGYCPIPPCTPYDASKCNAFFNLPLYPTAVSPPINN